MATQIINSYENPVSAIEAGAEGESVTLTAR